MGTVQKMNGTMLPTIKRNTFARLGLLLLLAWGSSLPAADEHWTLNKVNFEGLVNQSEAGLIPITGLKIGQTVTLADIKAAMERLGKTGMFSQLTFRYKYANGQLQVTFVVKENSLSIPCVLDNFVWFSEEEIQSAIRSAVPSFQGKAPEAGSILELISQSLAKLLRQRQLPGEINYLFSVGNLANPRKEHIFSVKGVTIPICSLQFPGASGLSQQVLIENSKPLMKISYSYTSARDYVKNNLQPLYIHHGYWRIHFEDPKARFVANRQNCQGGVDMTVPLEEGIQYHWAGARWAGNKLFPPQELDKMLAMKGGEIASDTKIEEGLRTIQKAYGRQGHLAANLPFSPLFEDSSADLVFEFKITEGPQYHMGKLNFTGLSERTAQSLLQRWNLPPDAVFDDSYPTLFFTREFSRVAAAEERGKNIAINIVPDTISLAVDVEFIFK